MWPVRERRDATFLEDESDGAAAAAAKGAALRVRGGGGQGRSLQGCRIPLLRTITKLASTAHPASSKESSEQSVSEAPDSSQFLEACS